MPDNIAVIGVVWVFFVTIFWMVVGWRAMKAHEKLARNSSEATQALRAFWRERHELNLGDRRSERESRIERGEEDL
jgi:hypothetical protein